MCPENTNTKNNIIFKIYVHNNKNISVLQTATVL